jgi:hypothetical protein
LSVPVFGGIPRHRCRSQASGKWLFQLQLAGSGRHSAAGLKKETGLLISSSFDQGSEKGKGKSNRMDSQDRHPGENG